MKIQDKYLNREKHTKKVLQFGEGNFLRAFVDWMIHMTNVNHQTDIGVTLIQPLAGGMVDKIMEQDALYTVVENGLKNGQVYEASTLVETITNGINPYNDFEAYLASAREETYEIIISNTTEAGIAFNSEDDYNDQPPSSYPAKLTRWLHERYKVFEGSKDSGMIIIPCELIENNGQELKKIILEYAKLWSLEEGFIKWLETANTFCNTLVDRIVPGYPRHKIDDLQERLGYEDQLIVETEPYYLWVIETDEVTRGRLPFDESLNIVYTDSLYNYRTRKVRLLNGPHTCMVPVGLLYGLETVRETVTHEIVGDYVSSVMMEEIIPAVPMDSDDLKDYATDVLDRFKNPFVKHQLMSISLNSHSKYRTRVLPTVKEYIEKEGHLPTKALFAFAAMLRLFKGDINGKAVILKDDPSVLDMHSKLWKEVDNGQLTLGGLVSEVLTNESLWFEDLNKIDGMTDLITSHLENICERGMEDALKELLSCAQ